MTGLRRAVLTLSAALIAACAGRKHAEPASNPETNLALPAIELAIANHNWLDVVVFVVHGGQRTRLTTVTAAKSASTLIPEFTLRNQGHIRLLAHAVGNPETFTSEVIVVRAGMRIEWTLETDLKRSSVGIY
jgi:hypothetical protein